jgi:hypothetical protein
MPFDGTGYEDRFEALEKIDKVIELLSDERRWCKKQLQTIDGRRCILGAMKAADATYVLKAPILQAIEQVTGRGDERIEMFNDHPLTTHALVVRVLHQARENMLDDLAGRLAAREQRTADTQLGVLFKPAAYLRRILRTALLGV